MRWKLTISLLLAFFVHRFAHAAPATGSIPFDYVDGFILVKAQLNGGQQVNLILDSGAGASILSLDTAHRLNLRLGANRMVQGAGTQAAAFELSHVKAKAGDIALSDIPLAVDLSNATELCSRRIDGLIGIDFFANRIVELDFAARAIHLLPSVPAADATTCKLPLKSMNGTYCIPIRVNSSNPRWARFDTGCNDALHWIVPRGKANPVRSNLSIGFMTDATDLAPSELQLGSHNLSAVETSLHTQPLFPGEAGLVGTGVLSRFVTTVDLAHKQIFLRPAK